MPDIARRGIACQDLKHLLQCFGRQLRILEPHAVLMPSQGPHQSRVALERSNATLQELLHHPGRSHTELLVAPSRVGDSRQCRMREQRAGHSDIHIQPQRPEPLMEGGRLNSIPRQPSLPRPGSSRTPSTARGRLGATRRSGAGGRRKEQCPPWLRKQRRRMREGKRIGDQDASSGYDNGKALC